MQDSKSAEVREEPCEITTDGWCATHSTADGPVYCERDAAARDVEWVVKS